MTGRTRYIGKTKDLKKRLGSHLAVSTRCKTPCSSWIKSLRAQGHRPVMEELAVMPEGDWQAWERIWISLYRLMGFDLLNANDGGGGISSARPETIAKYRTPEYRAKMRVAKLGHAVSAETRAKLSAAFRGRVFTPETRAKISVANKGQIRSDEARARMRGRWANWRLRKDFSKNRSGSLAEQDCCKDGKPGTD
jgi:hypothetical protein